MTYNPLNKLYTCKNYNLDCHLTKQETENLCDYIDGLYWNLQTMFAEYNHLIKDYKETFEKVFNKTI